MKRKKDTIYLKNPLAPLCGLCGLNLTAENAKKRKKNLAMQLLIGIIEMTSGMILPERNPALYYGVWISAPSMAPTHSVFPPYSVTNCLASWIIPSTKSSS